MQARSERTRRRLVRAAAETFDRSGYAGATLGQIARTAGLTKGALYFHFASKDDLAGAVQEQGQAVLRDFAVRQREAGAAPVQQLIDLTHWLAWTLKEDPVVRAGFRITGECAGRRHPAADFHQAWITQAVGLVEQARAAGDLSPQHDTDGPKALLSAAVCGLQVLAASGMPYPELRRTTAALWEFLLHSLVPAGHAGRYDVQAARLPARPATAA
ncbi:ScbR family autoregulator-binding transcription factor [Streptomyces werraensis]|uniref:ScbR family autoregulator-binding transcription factor n=1 Tax=Streptomyces werraensis TaxID=68284 RepID=UPI0034311741